MHLHHTDTGSGYPVVLIHGFCESLQIWNQIIPELSKSYRVVAIDLPGFGGSDLVIDKVTIENIADAVNAFLMEKGINECAMIGHSLGGYVALAYVEAYTSKLSALGLFHSTAYSDTDEKKINRNKTMAFIRKRGLDLYISSFVPSLFRSNDHPAITTVLNIALTTPVETVLKYTEAMRDRKDRTTILQTTKLPVLIIAGEYDNAVTLAKSVELSGMPSRCYFHVLEVGHMGMFEAPAQCCEILNMFLQNYR